MRAHMGKVAIRILEGSAVIQTVYHDDPLANCIIIYVQKLWKLAGSTPIVYTGIAKLKGLLFGPPCICKITESDDSRLHNIYKWRVLRLRKMKKMTKVYKSVFIRQASWYDRLNMLMTTWINREHFIYTTCVEHKRQQSECFALSHRLV